MPQCGSETKDLVSKELIKAAVKLPLLNNFVALRLWRLGARDILELPLLATSSKMETALMAGQT